MKKVVIEFLSGGQRLPTDSKGTVYKFKQSDYDYFIKNTVPELKSLTINVLKKYVLNTGYFYFDPSLWKWRTTFSPDKLDLYVTISFIDTNNEGKDKFMSEIRKTGMLKHSYKILIPYS